MFTLLFFEIIFFICLFSAGAGARGKDDKIVCRTCDADISSSSMDSLLIRIRPTISQSKCRFIVEYDDELVQLKVDVVMLEETVHVTLIAREVLMEDDEHVEEIVQSKGREDHMYQEETVQKENELSQYPAEPYIICRG